MLKKLKRKFILLSMALVTAVLLIVLGFNLITTYQLERSQIDRSLDRVMEMNSDVDGNRTEIHDIPTAEAPSDVPDASEDPTIKPFDRGDNFPKMGKDDFPQIYAFSVTVNADGDIISTFAMNAQMDESIMSQAIEEALSENGDSGTLGSLNLIYKKRTVNDCTQISFSSLSSLNQKMKQTTLISLAVFAITFLLLFAVSFVLSGFALRPVAEAWEHQKRFVADASHDLKTPLTVILANNNILRSHSQKSIQSQMKWIESTDEEATRMKALAEKMLELSHSENLKDTIELSPVDLSNLTEEIAMQMEPVAFEAGIELQSHIETGITIKSDSDVFSRIAHILIDNAIKYTNDGGSVEISLIRKRQGVTFSVKNSGAAISEEDLPHLFERFYRADKVRGIGGHGLGLSIAKNLAEALEGKIQVKSTAAEGTEFSVFFLSK